MRQTHLKKKGMSTAEPEPEAVCSVHSNQKVNQEFEIDSIKYHLDPEHEDDLLPPDTTVKPQIQDLPKCKLNMDKVKQLQVQDPHVSKVIVKCTSHSHHDKTPYIFRQRQDCIEKSGDRSNIIHAIMVSQILTTIPTIHMS